MVRLTLLLLALAAPAAGNDLCDDLWLARNAPFARGGHCFASPLGQATFGTRCTGPATPSPRERAMIAMVREEEARYGCAVDASVARALDVDHIELRLKLEDQPVNDGLESACIGWRGPAFPLRLGARPGAAAVAEVAPGATIRMAHGSPIDGWVYYGATQPTGLRIAGWAEAVAFPDDACAVFTG